jgi:hypothetical protein
LSGEGKTAAEQIEDATDRLACRPYSAVGEAGSEELVSPLRPPADPVMAAGAGPVPNPVSFRSPPD